MEENKTALLSDDQLENVSGEVLEDYGKSYIDTLIKNMKGTEGMGAADLIIKIEQMPPTFFDMNIGSEATMEEISEYVYQNWDKF